MKRILIYIIAVLLCIPFTSCEYLENILLPDVPECSLSVEMDNSPIFFEKDEISRTVSYTVTENSSKSCKVSVSGLMYVAAFVGDGSITFTPKGSDDFSETASVLFSNGSRTHTISIPMSRKTSTSPEMQESVHTFNFPEYARMFPVEIPDGVYPQISVPDDCRDWITAKIGTIGDDTKKYLFILLAENVGEVARRGKVTMTDTANVNRLNIEISQIGSEMDGSFKKAMLDFYSALDGKNWFKRKGDDDTREIHWNKNMSLIDFYGLYPSRTAQASAVDPDQLGKVYFGTEDEWTIYMPFNGLKGTIPESFWDACKNFTYITINRCYLQDSKLSDKVWHEKLEGINFEHTYIGGSISSSALTKATNLRVMNFNKCRISGEFPKEIAKLKELENIHFEACFLTGALPENIGNLSKLVSLNIGSNLDFGGTLPESFYDLVNLHDFYAGLTQLGGHISPRIGEMKNLKNFYINGCEFEGTIPEELGTLTRFVFEGKNNYFTEIPEFVRYSGCQNRWILIGGIVPSGVPSYQRKKETGRPADMYVMDKNMMDEMTADKYTDLTPFTFNEAKYTYYLPLPIWANIRYNIVGWEKYVVGTKVKKPEWPYAEDLQYPANEYYYDKDRKAWCHPKLEYPAREYYKDSKGNWVHDASCPWDQPYTYKD